MKPFETLAEAAAPDGGKLVLQRRDTEIVLRVNGQVLMTSRIRDSELALAEVATTDIRARNVTSPRVLVGGLGLAFTLRALLDALPETASITVAEVSEPDGEFVVAIRSALLRGSDATLYGGAGIVADSTPDSEYAETGLKMRPMLAALGVQ